MQTCSPMPQGMFLSRVASSNQADWLLTCCPWLGMPQSKFYSTVVAATTWLSGWLAVIMPAARVPDYVITVHAFECHKVSSIAQ